MFGTFARGAGAPSTGQDGPLLYPGRLCGGGSGSTGQQRGVDRARAWMPELRLRMSSCPMGGKRQVGGGLSLGHVSLATQRKVARAAKRHESPLP